MNKTIKLLTSTLCGVLLASSLTFMNVQAAPSQNSVKTNISSLSTNSLFSLSPAISSDGVLYWRSSRYAKSYTVKLYNITRSQSLGTGGFSADSCYDTLYDMSSSLYGNCTYSATITAYDGTGTVVSTATLNFYYDSNRTFKQQ